MCVLEGELVFTSSNDLAALFSYVADLSCVADPTRVVIDLSGSHV